jgi:hypothetical protein
MSYSEPAFVVATLWEYIEPLARGDRYEDPLNEVLEAQNLGEICGGGTQLSDKCGIEFVDIEIEVNDLKSGLAVAKETLEAQGAPKGSVFRFTEQGVQKTLDFGVTECLAVFLDGIGLPASVYKASDINILAALFNDFLSKDQSGEIRSCWVGPNETAIFLFGADAEKIHAALEPVLNSYPLCQNARIVIRHGNPSLEPRELRLPMLSY